MGVQLRKSERVKRQAMPVATSILWKPLRDPHYVVASLHPGGGGVRQIFVRQSTLQEVQTLVRDPAQSVVGLLLGTRFDCSITLTPYLLIDAHLATAVPWLEKGAATDAIQTLLGHLGRRHSSEVLGWYSSGRSSDAAVSPTLEAVHAAFFDEPWHTALTFGADGGAGAFYLLDSRAGRWFHAPFYEVTDSKAGSRAPKPTCVAWPAYLTTATVVPLIERPQPVASPRQAAPVSASVSAPVSGPVSPRVSAAVSAPVSSPAPRRPVALARPIIRMRRTPTRDAIAQAGRAAGRSVFHLAKALGGWAVAAYRLVAHEIGRIRARWIARAAERKSEADAVRTREAERKAREAERKAKEAAERRAAREEAQRKAVEAAKLRAAEAEARRAAEAEEQRKAAEELERRRAAEAEARRKAAEELQQRRAAEAEARRKAEEEAERRRIAEAEEAERRRAAEAEAKRQAAEAEARRRAEEAEARRAAEAEARRKAAEEAERKAAELEARRKADEEARRKAEEEKWRKAEEERQRKAAEEEQRRAAEAEARRQAAEEKARRKAAETEARRQAAEAEAQRKAAAEAERRRIAEAKEEERRRIAEAEEAERRRVAEAEGRRNAEEAERRRVAAAEEEERRRVAEGEEAERRGLVELEAAERRREAEAEARRQAAETDARQAAAEAEARRLAEAEAATQRQAAEAEARRQADDEAERIAAEAEAQRLAEEAKEQERRRAAEAAEEARRRAAEAEALRISVEVAAIRDRLARPRVEVEGSKREAPKVARLPDIEDTTASDGPYRYLALARREGFEVSENFERGTPEDSETVWLLREKESGLRLIVVTTDEAVREASLHYNLRTDDDSVLETTAPELRDLASRTIYGREECLDGLRARCRRLRATGALERGWKVSPALQPEASPR